jgi:hypothetical protein
MNRSTVHRTANFLVKMLFCNPTTILLAMLGIENAAPAEIRAT